MPTLTALTDTQTLRLVKKVRNRTRFDSAQLPEDVIEDFIEDAIAWFVAETETSYSDSAMQRSIIADIASGMSVDRVNGISTRRVEMGDSSISFDVKNENAFYQRAKDNIQRFYGIIITKSTYDLRTYDATDPDIRLKGSVDNLVSYKCPTCGTSLMSASGRYWCTKCLDAVEL